MGRYAAQSDGRAWLWFGVAGLASLTAALAEGGATLPVLLWLPWPVVAFSVGLRKWRRYRTPAAQPWPLVGTSWAWFTALTLAWAFIELGRDHRAAGDVLFSWAIAGGLAGLLKRRLVGRRRDAG